MNTHHLGMAAIFLLWGAVGLPAAESALAIEREQSSISIEVKATVDSFVGYLADYAPEIRVDAEGRVVSARVAFRFRDVRTGKDKRDRAMHDWQQTEKFPDGEFVLTSLTPGRNNRMEAKGRLNFHGITRELAMPVSFIREGARLSIDGDAAIDTRDFGLPVIRMMGLLKVDPIVHVRFHLQGRAGK
jgi:polyisoprenoid-binding protein YceI